MAVKCPICDEEISHLRVHRRMVESGDYDHNGYDWDESEFDTEGYFYRCPANGCDLFDDETDPVYGLTENYARNFLAGRKPYDAPILPSSKADPNEICLKKKQDGAEQTGRAA